MRALVVEGPGRARLVELPDPVPGPGEVVVRVRAALTCGTDLKLFRRGHPKIPFPAPLGHEWAGEVESVGGGVSFLPGERVTSSVTAPCGDCRECEAGRENLCATAFESPLFGAFADRLLVPARIVRGGLRRIPASLADEAGALLDPAASVLRGLSRLPSGPGATVLVAGAGAIALMFTVLLRAQGARVLVLGRRPARLAILAAHGAEVLDPEVDAASLVDAATAGRGVDAAIDAAGDPGRAATLVGLVARGGTLLLFAGMPRGTELAFPAARLHYDEVDVLVLLI
jgi:L-iditol 2-dehydrogenase